MIRETMEEWKQDSELQVDQPVGLWERQVAPGHHGLSLAHH